MAKFLEADCIVSHRSARKRFNLLCEKHKAKQRNELKAIRISCKITELDKALDDFLERVAESKLSHENTVEEKETNAEKEKNPGDKVRRSCQETFQKQIREILKKIQLVALAIWKRDLILLEVALCPT